MDKVSRLFLILLFLPLLVRGDGLIIAKGKRGSFQLVDGEYQTAIINYRQGVEKMIISVTAKRREKNALWLFPIPASPSSVKLEILPDLPELIGAPFLYNVEDLFRKQTRLWMYASQIYPIPYILSLTGGEFPHISTSRRPNILVLENRVKVKVKAEKIPAKDIEALYNYLRKKGFRITKGVLPMLDYYVGKDYTFIACWLSNTPINENEAQGVYVAFSTSRIYYPLLLTSAYGNKSIDVCISVIGYCTPQIPPPLESYSKVDFCYANFYDSGDLYTSPPSLFLEQEKPAERELLEEFFAGSANEKGFTDIAIKSPAQNFVSDLTIIPNALPRKISLAQTIVRYGPFIKVLLFLLCSCIASLIAGLLTLGRVKKDPLLFLYLGIFNFFSLLGMAIAVSSLGLVRKGEVKEAKSIEAQRADDSPTNQGNGTASHPQIFSLSSKMQLAFVILFSVFFLIIGFLTTDLLASLFKGI